MPSPTHNRSLYINLADERIYRSAFNLTRPLLLQRMRYVEHMLAFLQHAELKTFPLMEQVLRVSCAQEGSFVKTFPLMEQVLRVSCAQDSAANLAGGYRFRKAAATTSSTSSGSERASTTPPRNGSGTEATAAHDARGAEAEEARARCGEAAEEDRLRNERARAAAALREEQRSRVLAALASGPRLVVDLAPAYTALMSARHRRSLSQQLGRCWALNRRAPAPFAMHLASLRTCPAECLPAGGEHERWLVGRLDGEVSDHFGREGKLLLEARIVYLSPDAEEVLEVPWDSESARAPLEAEKTYVIGGRSSQPVDRAGVLTLPAAVDVLLRVHAGASWSQAMRAALPPRFFLSAEEEAEARAKRQRAKEQSRRTTKNSKLGFMTFKLAYV
ncbi:hypothetical protein EMIHUDRAFT_243275 [Emiliania huxleyi CCMP1516]|uniref:tRNA (guanine(9)-N(1))-methyltransferase n=2 Tax=Emiliania huxleyi TaxID=2903 RepID=A0A0D3J6H0_EMIH1|nr:hypothetical protein EMIHUDRAFT_243275 [Emiliania huxleyi CCMP1516]EOD19105.1 hypothetical protein EMIHUDRAFT_243275 [Emiliania huxleyi CCMP1516]|eukprot:XP_005771534.1 hypothetical protein EMIHUDRAFT_243275 [Emiliania huxleyi CCMP1516]